MKRCLAGILSLIMGVSVLTGCVVDVPEEGDNVNPSIYIPFDETGSRVVDVATQKSYDVNYVFENAKYKESESAKRTLGVIGKALSFDGYSTYIETEGLKKDTNALTISVWVAPRAYATRTEGKLTGIVSAKGNTGGFNLGMYNYGTWCFEVITNKGAYKLWSEEAIIDLYQWNYLTAVFDGQGKQMRLYLNGEEVASCDVTATTVKATDTTMLVGKSHDHITVENVFDPNMFCGLMDELEIYTGALTDAQIKEKYQQDAHAASVDISKEIWLDYEILADDRYAPQYHLRVSQNWQNETYGFFYYNGYYHAFCQQNVLGPYYTDGQRWGHFVSTDLVHWEEVKPALCKKQKVCGLIRLERLCSISLTEMRFVPWLVTMQKHPGLLCPV